jgi:hypothetical protein
MHSIHHRQTSSFAYRCPGAILSIVPQLGTFSVVPSTKSTRQAILPITVHCTYPKRHSIYRVLFINVPHNAQSNNPATAQTRLCARYRFFLISTYCSGLVKYPQNLLRGLLHIRQSTQSTECMWHSANDLRIGLGVYIPMSGCVLVRLRLLRSGVEMVRRRLTTWTADAPRGSRTLWWMKWIKASRSTRKRRRIRTEEIRRETMLVQIVMRVKDQGVSPELHVKIWGG